MNSIARSIQKSNAVMVFSKTHPYDVAVPAVFALYPGEGVGQSTFIDDPAMRLKIFKFPSRKMSIVFERERLRVEEEAGEAPDRSQLGSEAHRITQALFPKEKLEAFGFNYDIFYRFDAVIPQRDIMKQFVDAGRLEDVRDFGWQFTIDAPRKKRKEGYVFKVISPMEIALHANYHFEISLGIPSALHLQQLFEKCYEESGDIFKTIAF